MKPVPTTGAKRISLGLKVVPETKRLIDTMARATGRTQSAQVEYLVERCLQYDRVIEALRAEHEVEGRRQAETARARLSELERA